MANDPSEYIRQAARDALQVPRAENVVPIFRQTHIDAVTEIIQGAIDKALEENAAGRILTIPYAPDAGYHRAWGRAKNQVGYAKDSWLRVQYQAELEFACFRKRIVELENELVLAKANNDALGSVLLETQQDCIAAMKEKADGQ